MSSPRNGPPHPISRSENPSQTQEDFQARAEDVRLEVAEPLEAEDEDGNLKRGFDDGERERLLDRDVESRDVESGGGPRAEESLAEIEINSLLWIKQPGNEALKEAYETWQAKDLLFASRVDKKRKQSNALRNEIYQLIGFYSVFQGVLLTAVAQSNFLTCHNWWTAFFLSLLASLVTVVGVHQKFDSVLELEKTIGNEEISRRICINRVNLLLKLRGDFRLRTLRDHPRPVPSQTKLKVSAILVIFVLLVFSALFLASIQRILCDSGLSSPAAAPTAL